jgi:hypothetical protein
VVSTRISAKNIYQGLQATGLNVDDSLYRDEWKTNWVLKDGDISTMKGPEDIVARVKHVLFNPLPQQRYMVAGDAARAENTLRTILHQMLELNQDQPCTYNRDALIRLLDEEIEKMKQPTVRVTETPEKKAARNDGVCR